MAAIPILETARDTSLRTLSPGTDIPSLLDGIFFLLLSEKTESKMVSPLMARTVALPHPLLVFQLTPFTVPNSPIHPTYP